MLSIIFGLVYSFEVIIHAILLVSAYYTYLNYMNCDYSMLVVVSSCCFEIAALIHVFKKKCKKRNIIIICLFVIALIPALISVAYVFTKPCTISSGNITYSYKELVDVWRYNSTTNKTKYIEVAEHEEAKNLDMYCHITEKTPNCTWDKYGTHKIVIFHTKRVTTSIYNISQQCHNSIVDYKPNMYLYYDNDGYGLINLYINPYHQIALEYAYNKITFINTSIKSCVVLLIIITICVILLHAYKICTDHFTVEHIFDLIEKNNKV